MLLLSEIGIEEYSLETVFRRSVVPFADCFLQSGERKPYCMKLKCEQKGRNCQ